MKKIVVLSALAGSLAAPPVMSSECPMSGSTYLIINHEFNIIDPFTNNGFDYAYVGTSYDNVVDHYRG